MTTDVDAPGDKQLEIIRGLRGVVHAFYLDRTILEQIKEEEAKVRAMGNIAVDNQGFTEALKRESVICIVKDPRFRPPPEPTVVLDAGDGGRSLARLALLRAVGQVLRNGLDILGVSAPETM